MSAVQRRPKRFSERIEPRRPAAMSRPTPLVLFLVGAGMALFVLEIFAIGWSRNGTILALSICLISFGLYEYAIVKQPDPT